MRRALMYMFLLGLGACASGSCATPDELDDLEAPAPEQAPVVEERSPEEVEPFEPTPSEEATGAPVAAMHQQALREADPAIAAQTFEAACDRGFAPSCLALADHFESGEGVEADPERAAQLVEEACMSGSTLACDRLGH